VGLLLLQEADADSEMVMDVKLRGTDDPGTSAPNSYVPSANDVRYAHFVAALQHYKSLYGHVHVPASFIVPIQASPSSNDLIAPLSVRPSYAACHTVVAVAAASHPDTSAHARAGAGVDAHADASAWPATCIGLRLGQVLSGVRCKGNYVRDSSARQLELSRLGVELSCLESSVSQSQGQGYDLGQGRGQGQQQTKKWRRRRHSDDELLLALDIFRHRYGHMAVPGSYIVGMPHAPYARRLINSSAHFPSELMGLRLGTKVAHIRNRGSFPHLHASLTAMGFVWDPRNGCDGFENAEFRAIMDALAMYELTGQVASFD
jgi:hypothetical protein